MERIDHDIRCGIQRVLGPLYAWSITWATGQGSHLKREGDGLNII